MSLETGNRFFQSPSGGSSPQDVPSPIPHELRPIDYRDFVDMSEADLFAYIKDDLGRAETALLGPANAESKLIFLCGTLIRDPREERIKRYSRNIAKAKTFDGTPIYKNRQKYFKVSEIEEFIVVAGQVIHEGGQMEDLVSEAADIFYNLIRLSDLDTYLHAPDYGTVMAQTAAALGWTPKQALLVAANKYHSRYVERKTKDPEYEKNKMEDLLRIYSYSREAGVPTPTFEQIDDTVDFLEATEGNILGSRQFQIRAQQQDEIDGRNVPLWNIGK